MPWIESHTVLLRHRKLIELSKELRLKPVYVMGHLHALWHAALEQQEDGDLSSWSDDLIAEASGYQGDAPQYVSLLQHHRWLDGKILHDWLNYAGNYLSRKYHNSDRGYLKSVWLKHGKRYGKSTSFRKKKGAPDTGNLILSPVLNSSSEGGPGGTDLPAKIPKPDMSVQEFVESWNEIFSGILPTVEWPLARSRHDKAAARLKEHRSMDFWKKVFQNITASDFLMGKTGGTWKCNFDFLINNDLNATKIYEGSYGTAEQERSFTRFQSRR